MEANIPVWPARPPFTNVHPISQGDPTLKKIGLFFLSYITEKFQSIHIFVAILTAFCCCYWKRREGWSTSLVAQMRRLSYFTIEKTKNQWVPQGKRRGECCTPPGNDSEEKETWTPLMTPSLFPASPMEAHKATKCHLSMHNLENSCPPETIDKKKTKQKKKGRHREP